MKANKFMLAGMLVAAFAMVGCEPKNPADDNNGGNGQDTTVVEEPTIEEMPELAAPGDGKITIAVRVPENTTNGVWLIGYAGWSQVQDADANPACRFTRVEGTKTWWTVTMDFDASAKFKFLPICKNAEGNEYTAWAVEPTGMRQMLDNEPADEADFNKNDQAFPEGTNANSVVFFEVKGWSVDPSVVFMPAGTYKFLITLNKIDTLPIPAGDVVLTGNFAEESWGDSKRIMKQVSDNATAVVYEYEDVVPDYFCFKVFVQGETQTWANGENVPLSVDVVKDGVVTYDGFTFPAPAPAK